MSDISALPFLHLPFFLFLDTDLHECYPKPVFGKITGKWGSTLLGSESFVVLLITRNFNIYWVILVASVGNFLGACTSYYIRFTGRMHIIQKYFRVSDTHLEHAEGWFNKYGSW